MATEDKPRSTDKATRTRQRGEQKAAPAAATRPESMPAASTGKAVAYLVLGYFPWLISVLLKQRVEVDESFSRTDMFASKDPLVRAYSAFTGIWLIALGLVALYESGVGGKLVWVWYEIKRSLLHPRG